MNNHNHLPLATIAIPTYNRLTLLKQALASAQAQTYQNLEIVVFDNASTDGTGAWLKKQALQDLRIKLVTNPRNIGMKENVQQIPDKINGRYLLVLSDDDLIDKPLIEKAVQCLENDKRLSLWFCRTEIFQNLDGCTKSIGTTHSRYSGVIDGKNLILLSFRRKISIYWASVVYPTSILKNVGGFTCDSYWFDRAANLCCATQGKVYIDEAILTHYRLSNINMTKDIAGNLLQIIKNDYPVYKKIRNIWENLPDFVCLDYLVYSAMSQMKLKRYPSELILIYNTMLSYGFSEMLIFLKMAKYLPIIFLKQVMGPRFLLKIKKLLCCF